MAEAIDYSNSESFLQEREETETRKLKIKHRKRKIFIGMQQIQ
jgi:hypothetical protein